MEDINKGYEDALHYSKIDNFSVKLLWWNFAAFLFLTITNSYFRLADYIQSPFSWRVISSNEAIVAILLGFCVALLPTVLKNKFKNHYYYRLIVTFCLIFYSYLFVFITGGSIEAHFHFFIVIGYLVAYADWRLGWFAFFLTAFHHILLDLIAPFWVFFYGQNLLSPLAHSIPVIVAVMLTGVLCKTHRDALITQKDLEKRKDEFISMASHELKTPVTSIIIFTEVIQKMLNKKGIKEFNKSFSRIDEQLKKLTKLINDLLDISRIQAMKLAYNFSKFDLNELTRDIAVSMQQIGSKHTINVKGKVAKEVWGDKDRINQVLTNFLTNAIKYSPNANKIDISLISDTAHGIVCVSDYGIGVDEKYHDKIFERFYRVYDDDEKTYPGMGIGLYISFEIIKQHNGAIWFESEKGKGSSFYFSIPFYKRGMNGQN